jgi:hypothetical protein
MGKKKARLSAGWVLVRAYQSGDPDDPPLRVTDRIVCGPRPGAENIVPGVSDPSRHKGGDNVNRLRLWSREAFDLSPLGSGVQAVAEVLPRLACHTGDLPAGRDIFNPENDLVRGQVYELGHFISPCFLARIEAIRLPYSTMIPVSFEQSSGRQEFLFFPDKKN